MLFMTEFSHESGGSYVQIPLGLRSAVEGTPMEERLREAANKGLYPEGFASRMLRHALGEPDALTEEDTSFQAWLEAPPETP